MFEREIALNQFMLGYCDQLVEGLTDEQFVAGLAGGGHSPQWILGHLTMVTDYAGMMLGIRAAVSKELRAAFAPGVTEAVMEGDAFSREALSGGLRPAYERLYETARNADEDALATAHGIDLFAGTSLVTKADFVAHVFTTHFATHAGQLSAWRRAQGQLPLF